MARLKQKCEFLEAQKELITKWFGTNPNMMITLDEMTELFRIAVAELLVDKEIKYLPREAYDRCICSKSRKDEL